MDRIDAIRKSLAAFVCGLFGLVPVIGMPFAVAAIVYFIRARLRKSMARPRRNPSVRARFNAEAAKVFAKERGEINSLRASAPTSASFALELTSWNDTMSGDSTAGWNPAETYLDWGVRFAILGLVITLLLIALVMAIAIQMGQQRGHSDWFL